MALPILDGNQSLTNLSTVVSGGAHIPAHTIVSFGSQAITDIANAISGSSVNVLTMPSINVTATVTGGLTNSELRASPVTIGGSVTASISGTPSVTFGTAVVTGSASILNFPATQTVTFTQITTHGVTIGAGTAQIGSVTARISGTVAVSGTFYQATQPVSIASLPSLAAGTNQVGSVTASLNQGGTAVGSANPLQVTLANTGANSTAIKVDGSTSTQPISGTVTANIGNTPDFIGGGYTNLTEVLNDGAIVVQSIETTINANVNEVSVLPPITGTVTVGSLPAISGTVTANVPLYEYDIQYIRCSFNITDINESNVSGNVYLRKIGEYTYESIRYAGGEDEAYVKIYLQRNYPAVQDMWRFQVSGSYADITGNLAFRFPQDAGNFGSSLPPNNGWALETGYSGTISISHEQPQLNNIQGTVTVGNSVTIGSLPAISGTVTANNPNGGLTTRFGSVTTANLSQLTSCVTNSSRKYLLAQNISSGTVTIGIGFSPTTTQGIQLTAGAGISLDSFCPTGAVYWLGATTGANFTILEG